MFGYVYELFIYSGKGFMMMNFLLQTVVTDSPESVKYITDTAEAILRSSSIAIICILVTLVTSFICFSPYNKISKIEQAEASMLLQD